MLSFSFNKAPKSKEIHLDFNVCCKRRFADLIWTPNRRYQSIFPVKTIPPHQQTWFTQWTNQNIQVKPVSSDSNVTVGAKRRKKSWLLVTFAPDWFKTRHSCSDWSERDVWDFEPIELILDQFQMKLISLLLMHKIGFAKNMSYFYG